MLPVGGAAVSVVDFVFSLLSSKVAVSTAYSSMHDGVKREQGPLSGIQFRRRTTRDGREYELVANTDESVKENLRDLDGPIRFGGLCLHLCHRPLLDMNEHAYAKHSL
jgi:hypothetical protein